MKQKNIEYDFYFNTQGKSFYDCFEQAIQNILLCKKVGYDYEKNGCNICSSLSRR
ncbi:hypothetical protein AAK894_11445 [Lachnospiraceae bacterium 46-61]